MHSTVGQAVKRAVVQSRTVEGGYKTAVDEGRDERRERSGWVEGGHGKWAYVGKAGAGQRGKRAGQEVMRWRVAVPVFT